MLQRYLLLWLLVLSAVAYGWPEILAAVNLTERLGDPFEATKKLGLLRPVFAVAMFCIGGLLPRDELLQLRKRWFTVLAGTSIQYTVMPLLAVAVAMVFRLGVGLTVGLMLVGCVPGAMASNVLTLAARGNVSYSVSLTTSATLLSPLIVPAVLSMTLGTTVEFDPLQIFANLLTDVVGPVIGGHLLSRFIRPAEKAFQYAGPTVANLAILWIIATVVGLTRSRLAEITPLIVLALLLINVGGYAAGWFGGAAIKIPEPMRRALTLEVGMQNAGLGAVLATTHFSNYPEAAIPTAAYTFGCMLTGAILAHWWSRRLAEPETMKLKG